MKKPASIFILLFFLLFNTNTYSQLSISYYSSSLSKIGLGFNFSERWWTELKLFSNTELEDITPELVVCFNFVQKERHAVYAGIGASVNYISGPVLPVGVRFTPFEKFDRFSLHIELEPTLDIENDVILQASWGLRYMFRHKKG